jgi:hypothetical protein
MLDPDRNPLDWSGPGYYAGCVNKANRLCEISLPESPGSRSYMNATEGCYSRDCWFIGHESLRGGIAGLTGEGLTER